MQSSWQRIVDLRTIERWLLPADLERQPRFHNGLFSSSRAGLRMLGIIEIAITFFLTHSGFRAAAATAGVITIGLASVAGVRRHLRTITLVSGVITAAASIANGPAGLLGTLSLLLFAVVTAAPLVPLQTCVLGSAIGLMYGIAGAITGTWNASLQMFILFLTCFATWASGMLYEQKREVFEAHQRSLEVQETLSTAQTRAQLAETAMSLGRLAAALTHEINTPLGALKSAVGTMLLLAERQRGARPEEQERLSRAQADLSRSVESSVERLSTVVGRLKRLIALEHDDKQTVNVNDLLTDAGLMIENKLRPEVHVAWDLQPVAQVVCSTRQLTLVFANLLSNAAGAIDGAGEIRVSTAEGNGLVQISITDNGRGMDADDAETIFDPGFRVEDGRVLGGNWSLFTARQIVNEHGGEIWIESELGRGTTAHLSLPALR